MEKEDDDRMLPFTFDLAPSALSMVHSLESLAKLKEAFSNATLIGIDTETQPAFKKRRWNHFQTHPTSIIQIATRSRSGVEAVFIVDMLVCLVDNSFQQALDETLLKVLLRKDIIKVGQGLESDFDELHLSYPSMKCFEVVYGIIETHALVKELQPDVLQMLSLKALVKTYLHYELLKTQQCSNWGKRPLSTAQIQYAACDALILLRLYDAMLCEIEELYMDRNEEEFCIDNLTKVADLTLPRVMTVSAKKRKSTFFETREQLRVCTQQEFLSKSTTDVDYDTTSGDSTDDDESKNINWGVQRKALHQIKATHTRFVDC